RGQRGQRGQRRQRGQKGQKEKTSPFAINQLLGGSGGFPAGICDSRFIARLPRYAVSNRDGGPVLGRKQQTIEIRASRRFSMAIDKAGLVEDAGSVAAVIRGDASVLCFVITQIFARKVHLLRRVATA